MLLAENSANSNAQLRVHSLFRRHNWSQESGIPHQKWAQFLSKNCLNVFVVLCSFFFRRDAYNFLLSSNTNSFFTVYNYNSLEDNHKINFISESYLACGNSDGIIKVFLMKIASTTTGMPTIALVKAYSFLEDSDGISVDCMTWYRQVGFLRSFVLPQLGWIDSPK